MSVPTGRNLTPTKRIEPVSLSLSSTGPYTFSDNALATRLNDAFMILVYPVGVSLHKTLASYSRASRSWRIGATIRRGNSPIWM